MDNYLFAVFGLGLPLSIFGILGAFLCRKARRSAIFAGIVGAISLPMLILIAGILDRPDLLLVSILHGFLFGVGISHVKG